jgi:uncharacterized protein involved in response to NO
MQPQTASMATTTLPALRLLAAAPHRLLFFVGASNVLLAMAWWTAWLAASRLGWTGMPQPPVYAGWMHAVVMQYQVLPPFVFGFLLTVFPRWSGTPALPAAACVPVGLGLVGGHALTLAGLAPWPALLVPGLVLTALGWAWGLALLLRVLADAEHVEMHAASAAAALLLGLVGLGFAIAHAAGATPLAMYAAIRIGSFGLLLPIYATVCHRMLPFFTQCVVPGYVMWRPRWALAAIWTLSLGHLALELVHAQAWLWLADAPLAAIAGLLLLRWWPSDARTPALLCVLYIGWAWLPLAMGLHAAQSLGYLVEGEFIGGRAPTHALFIGFFGSLLVAMVTRVTHGHSGRALELGATAAFAFVVVQAAALVRIAGDFGADPLAWHAIAGALWLAAFAPWVLHSAMIYLSPRIDGKPG